jgi:hypothetical protein
MKYASKYIVVVFSLVWSLPIFALEPIKTTVPTIQPKTIIEPVPVKIVAPINVPVKKIEIQQLPVKPLVKPTATIPTTEKTAMPPDDFGKTSRPPDPLERSARPPDPLERNAMPPDDFGKTLMPSDPVGVQSASLRLVNQITKGEMVSEPGKLENTGPRIFKNISKKDLEQPELATAFANDLKVAVPGVKNIALENNSVKVSYEREAKVFWLVAVKYQMTAEGNIETGKVEVKKPWWLSFAKNDAHKFESALRGSKDTAGELGKIVQLKLEMKMEQRAKTIETLSNIMRKISTTDESIAQNIK